MGFSVSLREGPGYLVLKITGEWNVDKLKNVADWSGAELKTRKDDRVLVDMSEVSGRPPDMDRFRLGEYVASTRRGVKVAVVFPKEHINRLFEDTAVNRGAWINVFGDEQAALEWLMADRSE